MISPWSMASVTRVKYSLEETANSAAAGGPCNHQPPICALTSRLHHLLLTDQAVTGRSRYCFPLRLHQLKHRDPSLNLSFVPNTPAPRPRHFAPLALFAQQDESKSYSFVCLFLSQRKITVIPCHQVIINTRQPHLCLARVTVLKRSLTPPLMGAVLYPGSRCSAPIDLFIVTRRKSLLRSRLVTNSHTMKSCTYRVDDLLHT